MANLMTQIKIELRDRVYVLELYVVLIIDCFGCCSMQAELDRHPAHWFSDIHMYSMAELVQVSIIQL